jgi:predicted anti-sigma-YlaC factor YlaD
MSFDTHSSSCFFFQNLLSDYLEGILPSSRHEEVKNHVTDCPHCELKFSELKAVVGFLHTSRKSELLPEMSIRIAEAAQAKKRIVVSRRQISVAVFTTASVTLAFLSLVFLFPNTVPFLSVFQGTKETQFTRFFPLLHGATEVLEDQTNWIQSRETLGGSIWEEGGLSPDEFEKAFQLRPSNLPPHQ